jgi:hypothetical protein
MTKNIVPILSVVIFVLAVIIIVLGVLLGASGNKVSDNCGSEIASVSNTMSANTMSANTVSANINTINYKKLCYYLLSAEFMKDNSISTADKNALKTYSDRNFGKDLDLYFIRDSYIPLIKEFTTETKMSYDKFKGFENIILEGIKQKEKR